MNKLFKLIVKKNVFTQLIHPQFYISSISLLLFSSISFFVGQTFFSPDVAIPELKSLFFTIPYICILIVPVLCIKNHNEDFDSFLPISENAYILAKWVSCLILLFIQLIPLVLISIIYSIFYSADIGQIVCGFLGIIFYFCSVSAITIFIFEAVPTGAFIISALLLALFNFADSFLFFVRLPTFFSKIVHSVSFIWHFDSFGKGVFDTRDFVFFIVITLCFLFFTSILVEVRKGRKIQSKQVFLFIGLIFLVFTDNNRFYSRIDCTESKKNTISKFSKDLLNQVDEPILITYYCSNELQQIYPEISNITDFLNEYGRISSKIQLNFIDPSDPDTQKTLLKYAIQPQQFRSSKDNENDFIQVYSAILIEYLDKHEVIPFILTNESLEYDLAVRMQHLIQDKQHSVYILCGNGLQLESDYSYVMPWLFSQGFECIPLNIESNSLQLTNTQNPLILIGSSQLSDEQSAEIELFALNGGKVLSFVSPFDVNITSDWNVSFNKDDNFLRVLSSFGFSLNHQLLADILNKKITLIGDNNSSQAINYPFWIQIKNSSEGRSNSTLFWASPIQIYNKNIQSLLQTNESSWAVSPNSDENNLFVTNPFRVSEVENGKMQTSSKIVAAKLNGEANGYYTGIKSSIKMSVVADQYFVNSLLLGYISSENSDYTNLQTFSILLLDLLEENDLVSLYKKSLNNVLSNRISVKTIKDSRNLIFIVFFAIIPVLILSIRFVIAIFRKKRYKK